MHNSPQESSLAIHGPDCQTFFTEISHMLRSIISGNEIPDSEMSVGKYCCISLHTTALNLHIFLFAMVMLIPQITLCLICHLRFPWLTERNCLAVFEKVCLGQIAFQSDQQFSASTGQLS